MWPGAASIRCVFCPTCGALEPRPGAINRYGSLTVAIGFVISGLVGAVWGYFTTNLSGAIDGAILWARARGARAGIRGTSRTECPCGQDCTRRFAILDVPATQVTPFEAALRIE